MLHHVILEIQHGIFWGINFWSRDFLGFCWKPSRFFCFDFCPHSIIHNTLPGGYLCPSNALSPPFDEIHNSKFTPKGQNVNMIHCPPPHPRNIPNFSLGDSRKFPYHTTDGFHILTPPPAFGISKMRYPLMPSDFHNRKPDPPSRSDFPFFCQTLRKYLQGSLICPIWLNLGKILSNDSTSV